MDDELPGLAYLKMLCEQLPELEVVKAFNDPQLFLDELPTLDFDLCILDIEMPGINGLQIANLLGAKPVIFTTAYSEYAADAFDLNAADYLRKPVKIERLKRAVEKAAARFEKHPEPISFIQLNTDKGKARLYFDHLVYFKVSETDSRDKIVLLENNTSLTLKNISFEKLLGLLPASRFCRVNKREIIALKSVQYFSHSIITTSLVSPTGQPLILDMGEVYRNDFIKKANL